MLPAAAIKVSKITCRFVKLLRYICGKEIKPVEKKITLLSFINSTKQTNMQVYSYGCLQFCRRIVLFLTKDSNLTASNVTCILHLLPFCAFLPFSLD